MNNPTNKNGNEGIGRYRPKLSFYHPNARGTGCAVKMELHPAHDSVDGSIMMTVANQMTVGDRRGPNPTFPRFDWKEAIVVKLDFNDLCHLLQVLRGECESINDGKGLYHRSTQGSTCIKFRHLIEPVAGYSLELYRRSLNGNDERSSCIVFSSAESTGLGEAISGAMAIVGFGIPMLVSHDTTAYKAEMKELQDGSQD